MGVFSSPVHDVLDLWYNEKCYLLMSLFSLWKSGNHLTRLSFFGMMKIGRAKSDGLHGSNTPSTTRLASLLQNISSLLWRVPILGGLRSDIMGRFILNINYIHIVYSIYYVSTWNYTRGWFFTSRVFRRREFFHVPTTEMVNWGTTVLNNCQANPSSDLTKKMKNNTNYLFGPIRRRIHMMVIENSRPPIYRVVHREVKKTPSRDSPC